MHSQGMFIKVQKAAMEEQIFIKGISTAPSIRLNPFSFSLGRRCPLRRTDEVRKGKEDEVARKAQ